MRFNVGNLVELKNQISLDDLKVNIRWMNEWKRYRRPHSREVEFSYSVFWLILSGTMVIEINSIKYEVSVGDIVIIPKQTPFRWISTGSAPPFHHLSIACETRVLTFDLLKMYQFPFVYRVEQMSTYQKLISHWREMYKRFTKLLKTMGQNGLPAVSADSPLINSIFMLNTDQTLDYLETLTMSIEWINLIFSVLRPSLPEKPYSCDSRVFIVCNYIQKNLHTRPSLDELAGLVHLSKEHLRTLFNRDLGVSPMKYSLQSRMERACELLLLSSRPMKSISEELGYADQHHFTRDFHRTYSMSPTNYRQIYKPID